MKPLSRFDIEQEILQVCNFVEILRNYADMVYEGEFTSSSQDDIHTTLHGYAHLLEAHSDKMMQSHKRHFKIDNWSEHNE